MPSMALRPEVGSKKRGSRLTMVDLPAPDGPTNATIWPAGMSSSTSRSTARSSP